jgi:hypothetical protein
MKKSNSKI